MGALQHEDEVLKRAIYDGNKKAPDYPGAFL
jgi:hypothetical protein